MNEADDKLGRLGLRNRADHGRGRFLDAHRLTQLLWDAAASIFLFHQAWQMHDFIRVHAGFRVTVF